MPLEHQQLGLRVRCGVTQGVFDYASAFNQPVEAWDVGQVIRMDVRRRVRRRETEGLG